MSKTTFNIKTLCAGIKKLGICPGDTVIIHASMKSIGPVLGGPQAVISAFQHVVTPRGTIIMPAFSYNFERIYEKIEPYDPETTPSQVGLLSESFRNMKGVVRSSHPTHSVAAWGRLAKELTEGHDKISGLAVNSPFHRAARSAYNALRPPATMLPLRAGSDAGRHGAKLCMIGCGFTSLSLLHVAEEVANLPFLSIFNWWHVGWKPAALIKRNGEIDKIKYPSIPGCSKNFGAAEELARGHKLLREGKLGNARVLLADAGKILEIVVRRLVRQNDFLLCPAGTCRACDERRSFFELSTSPEAKLIGEFLIDVVNRTGIRLAGSEGEDKAAEIIAERMQACGLHNVGIKRFPVKAWRPGFSKISVKINGKWESFKSAPVAHGPATSSAGVEGLAVNLENAEDLLKVSRSNADIAVLWGGYGAFGDFKQLMDSPFKAFIFIDNRFGHNDPVAIGVPSQWLCHFTKPMVSMPFGDAVRVFGHGPALCRLTVGGHNENSSSTVVTGEIAGSGSGVILVCAHHDTTFNSPAPDDNLSGVAGLLAIVQKLRNESEFSQTIRFCSFGAEEMLSEGARWYALESGLARDVHFVVNNDGIGARVGNTEVFVAGAPSLSAWIRKQIMKSPLQIKVKESIDPTSDQFPFNTLGIPSFWFHRRTVASGRHFHHTTREGLAEISFQWIADLAAFQAEMIKTLARADKFPFAEKFTPGVKAYIAAKKRDWLQP